MKGSGHSKAIIYIFQEFPLIFPNPYSQMRELSKLIISRSHFPERAQFYFTESIVEGIDFGENWSHSAQVGRRGNLGVMLYSDTIELKFETLIGLGSLSNNSMSSLALIG